MSLEKSQKISRRTNWQVDEERTKNMRRVRRSDTTQEFSLRTLESLITFLTIIFEIAYCIINSPVVLSLRYTKGMCDNANMNHVPFTARKPFTKIKKFDFATRTLTPSEYQLLSANLFLDVPLRM